MVAMSTVTLLVGRCTGSRISVAMSGSGDTDETHKMHKQHTKELFRRVGKVLVVDLLRLARLLDAHDQRRDGVDDGLPPK